ncbi:MAG: UDP-glucose/GDP-mannose dehydrogenase family protein [Gemmataceae bacterium]|nr:UDP-glucose/GDP-mannose dehydrogenase family protein [Gemmataceae bacterium]
MKIAIIGTGYVGLVTATCLAESGNEVVGIDKDARKIETLEAGQLPIYEPGLLELVQRNRRESRLTFSTDLAAGVRGAELIFVAVGTPQADDGSADLSALWAVTDAVADAVNGSKVLVIKSTVPVGTNRRVGERLAGRAAHPVDVASNPEFLKEGAAVDDFMKPDRVVVGVRRPEVGELLRELYAPFLRTERPFLIMSPESAEMTKYVANAMLATKISFINEMANLCERMGADVNDVRRGIGHDERIGFQFLFPGVGFGGSCFPKDIYSLICMSRQAGLPAQIMEAVQRVNDAQKQVLAQKIRAHYGAALAEKTIAVWGLAFKPRTDDVREAPALVLIDEMLAAGVNLRVHDPEALRNVRDLYGDRLIYCDRPYGALEGADGLAIVTEWQEFRRPDFELMRRLLREQVIFDGRNLYEPRAVEKLGFTYYGIGRQGGGGPIADRGSRSAE